jgi:hypothetical protein
MSVPLALVFERLTSLPLFTMSAVAIVATYPITVAIKVVSVVLLSSVKPFGKLR